MADKQSNLGVSDLGALVECGQYLVHAFRYFAVIHENKWITHSIANLYGLFLASEQPPLDETSWDRGWRDTISVWTSWYFVILDAVVCVVIGSIFEWYYGLGLFVLCLVGSNRKCPR